MLREKTLLKEYYNYLKDLFQKYDAAFRTTSNELIDIRLAILVIKGYSKEYYKSPNEDIYNEFKQEVKKYTNSIKSIAEQRNQLKKQLDILIEKKEKLEDSSSYSEKQDQIYRILTDVQKDLKELFPIINKDILKVQKELSEKILKHGVNPTKEFNYDDMEAVYNKVLESVNKGVQLARRGNARIKEISNKIEELNKDKTFDKITKEETKEEIDKKKQEFVKEEIKDEIKGEEYKASKVDKRILLRISTNKLKAYIRLKIPRNDDNPILEQNIRKTLEENNVTYGIIEENISYISDSKPRRNVLVARGKEAVPGSDARIEYQVNFFHKPQYEKESNGTIDFKETNAYQPVEKGDILAIKVPAQKGEDGITVQNETIPSYEGNDRDFKLGENATLSDDKRKVIALRKGLPIINGKGAIDVSNLLLIPSDIDYSTGNINFNGEVIIGGDVLDSFEVKAQDDILIKGNVYQAKVESVKGSVKIEKGANGDGNALIKAKKSIRAKYIEGAKVYCGENLDIHTDIMHSTVYVDGNLSCRKGKGLITGGYTAVGKVIECNILGSKSYTPTTIDLGVNVQLREDQYKVVMKLTEIKNYITKARNLLEKIKNKYKGKKISKINYRRYISIKRAHNDKINEFAYKKKEFDDMEDLKYENIKKAQLIVRKITYPKVLIKAGKIKHEIKTEAELPLLYKYDDENDEVINRRIKPDEGFLEEDIGYEEKKNTNKTK